MRVFVTGGSGFIGSAVVADLFASDHQVLALARSDASADALRSAGADVLRGDLDDFDSLREGGASCDGVIHCAFGNDFSKLAASSAQDSEAIEALGAGLKGTNKPLVVTSVVMMGIATPGQPAVEGFFDRSRPNPLRLTETASHNVADQGVNVSVVRLPQVHDTTKQGIPSLLAQIAHHKKVSAYVGEGLNRWAAAHRLDVARLYRLALERAEKGSCYHAVAEEGVAVREIASVIGEELQLPVVSISDEEAKEHFGPLAMFVGLDLSASNELTNQRLNWSPTGPSLLKDLEQAGLSKLVQ